MVQSSNVVHGHGENALSPRWLFSSADWRWIFAKLLQGPKLPTGCHTLLQVSVSLRRVDSVLGEETSLNIAKKTPRGPRIPQEPVSYAHTLGEVPQLPSGFSLPPTLP
jgi:hypothetical protein